MTSRSITGLLLAGMAGIIACRPGTGKAGAMALSAPIEMREAWRPERFPRAPAYNSSAMTQQWTFQTTVERVGAVYSITVDAGHNVRIFRVLQGGRASRASLSLAHGLDAARPCPRCRCLRCPLTSSPPSSMPWLTPWWLTSRG